MEREAGPDSATRPGLKGHRGEANSAKRFVIRDGSWRSNDRKSKQTSGQGVNIPVAGVVFRARLRVPINRRGSSILNTELCRKALEKVGNPNILVNLVSRRVRQLNSTGSRPLVDTIEPLGVADIALLEIVEDTITFEDVPEVVEPETPVKRRRRS
jgi:DNA-directed RNA polymerase subunit omega